MEGSFLYRRSQSAPPGWMALFLYGPLAVMAAVGYAFRALWEMLPVLAPLAAVMTVVFLGCGALPCR